MRIRLDPWRVYRRFDHANGRQMLEYWWNSSDSEWNLLVVWELAEQEYSSQNLHENAFADAVRMAYNLGLEMDRCE